MLKYPGRNEETPPAAKHPYLLMLLAVGSVLIATFAFLESFLFYRSFKFHSRYDAEESLRFVVARFKGHIELMKFIPDAPPYLNSLTWLDDELHEHPGIYGVMVKENGTELVNTFQEDPTQGQYDLSNCSNGISQGAIYILCRSVELLPEKRFFFLIGIDTTEHLRIFHRSILIGSTVAFLSFILFYLSWYQTKRLIAGQEELERKLLASEKLSFTGKLAAMIAHEIRNPLNALSMAVQYIQTTGENSPEMIDIIKQETAKLKELSSELFGMQSDFASQMEDFSIIPVIMDIEAKFSQKASSSGIDFICEYPKEDLIIKGNRKWLSRALENLIRNALEAKPSRVQFRVKIHNKTVAFTVEDDGYGISESEKTMIFDPFYTRKKEGFGLGLYIVKRVAEAHGGYVTVESSGQGNTSFTLKIPVEVDNVSRKI